MSHVNVSSNISGSIGSATGNVSGSIGPATWNHIPEHIMENRKMLKVIKRFDKKYFFAITVNTDESVYFQIYNGGIFSYLFMLVTGRLLGGRRRVRGDWIRVSSRSHLAATLGSAYDAVEEEIARHRANKEFFKNVRDLLKTKPENLKMIGKLEKLENGDPNESDPLHATNWTYTSNINVSGTGAFYVAPQ